MLKKFIFIITFLGMSFQAYALDFLSTKLENLDRAGLHKLLTANGGRMVTQDELTATYDLKGGSVPYATAAKAYYNPKGQFVGLNLGFPYAPHYYLTLRKSLLEKYGRPKINSLSFTSNFDAEHFMSVAVWNFKDNTSIEFNSDTFNRNKLDGTDVTLFYRHEARKQEMLNALKSQQLQEDKSKFKNVF